MARTIHLEWNRTSGEITPSEGYRLKRNETVSFILAPKKDRVPSTFDAGWALRLTLKVKGNYYATPLLIVSSWTDAGDGTYTKTVQISSAEIDAALEADETLTDDLAEVECAADLSLSISSAAPEKSDTIFVTLQNCVSDDANDGDPASSTVGMAFFTRNLTGNVGLLDGQSLIVADYLNNNGYSITQNGDSTIFIL